MSFRLHILLSLTLLSLLCPSFASSDPSKLKSSRIKTDGFTGKNPRVRLKDICHFGNVRENQLVGYGLVVGLNGTGDTLSSSPQTKESVTAMLERLGVNIRDGAVPSGKNIAAVMVTSTLPAFARQGSKVDINVSALGDAKNLQGGTLIVTPLLGADGEVYAVAQGSVAVSGFSAQGKAASQTKGVPTSGKISNGAIVEKEVGFELVHLKNLSLTLNNPDFTTAKRISDAINLNFKRDLAFAVDSSSVRINVTESESKNLVSFMTDVEAIEVEPDQMARVVIDDQNSVIAVTSNVRISPIALTHGSITIKIVEAPQVYMPSPSPQNVSTGQTVQIQTANLPKTTSPSDQVNALIAQQKQQVVLLTEQHTKQIETYDLLYPVASRSDQQKKELDELKIKHNAEIEKLRQGQAQQMNQLVLQNQSAQQSQNNLMPVSQNTSNDPNVQFGPNGAVVTDQSNIDVREDKGKFALLESGANLEEFVNALNALGASPKDLTAILQSIKSAGALQAEIIVT